MSTLTEKITEALEAHIFDKPIGLCRCNAEMSTTGHRTREHRAHLAEITAVVVAEWLTTLPVTQIAAAEILGRTATVAAVEALSTLAAEAVKGAE